VLNLTAFSACLPGIHHIRNWHAISHRYRYLSYAHLPRRASVHSDRPAVHQPGWSLRRSSSAYSVTYPAILPRLRTRRRGKPSVTLPSYEHFRARHSRSRSIAVSDHRVKTRSGTDDCTVAYIFISSYLNEKLISATLKSNRSPQCRAALVTAITYYMIFQQSRLYFVT
jgi:hypothetical protein